MKLGGQVERVLEEWKEYDKNVLCECFKIEI